MSGRDLTLSNRNPANGKYGLAFDPVTKDVLTDTTQAHAVMTQLVEWRNRWWADADGTHGSTINEIKQLTASTASDAEASARQALALLESKKLITVKSVRATRPPAGSLARFLVTVAWTTRGGENQSTQVSI